MTSAHVFFTFFLSKNKGQKPSAKCDKTRQNVTKRDKTHRFPLRGREREVEREQVRGTPPPGKRVKKKKSTAAARRTPYVIGGFAEGPGCSTKDFRHRMGSCATGESCGTFTNCTTSTRLSSSTSQAWTSPRSFVLARPDDVGMRDRAYLDRRSLTASRVHHPNQVSFHVEPCARVVHDGLGVLRGDKSYNRRRYLNIRQLQARVREHTYLYERSRPVDWNNTADRIFLLY